MKNGKPEKKGPTMEVFTPNSPNLPAELQKIVGGGRSLLLKGPQNKETTFQRMDLFEAAKVLEAWTADTDTLKLAARSMSMGCCIMVDKHKERLNEIEGLRDDLSKRMTAQLKAENMAGELVRWSGIGNLLADISSTFLKLLEGGDIVLSRDGLTSEDLAALLERINEVLEQKK